MGQWINRQPINKVSEQKLVSGKLIFIEIKHHLIR